MSPTLLYLGLPWLTGALVFSIQGVTTVIVVFDRALGPIGRSTQCVRGNTGLPGSAAKQLLQSSPGDSWVRRVETLKGHTCSWTDLLSKRCDSIANHVSFNSNQTTWQGCGVHTKQIHSYYSGALACRNNREQDTITPWEVPADPTEVLLGTVITLHVLPLLVGMPFL